MSEGAVMSEGSVEGSGEGSVGVEGTGSGEAAAEVARPEGASAVLASHAEGDTPSESAPTGGDSPAWQSGLSAEDVSLFSDKGWDKSENPVAEIVKGYRNAERLRGTKADQLVRVPEPGNEEQQAEFNARMGVPESIDGYESPHVEVLGGQLEGGVIAQLSHRINATPAQHAELMHGVGELLTSMNKTESDALNAKLSAEEVDLRNEWGSTFKENKIATGKGFSALEWDASTIDAVEAAIGHKAVMKLGALVGRMTGEHRRGDDASGGSGAPTAYGLTKEEARAALKREGAELTQKASNGESAAKERIAQLNKVAWH